MEDVWKNKALKKQLSFKSSLGLTQSGMHNGISYAHILSNEDAANGANFYCYKQNQEWANLQAWASKSKGKKINFEGEGLKNLLRSEHIPYNIFYPLEKLRIANPSLLNSLLVKLFDGKINVTEVLRIKVEFASDIHKSKLLNDNTSFDAYIEYKDGNELCALGIEVKYTEKSYPYGETEKARIEDPTSEYNQLSKKYYSANKLPDLHSKKLKQPWRNHLLGFKLVEKGILNKFHSVIMYPKGNTYQGEVCVKYKACLLQEYKDNFLGLTFEDFVAIAEKKLDNYNDKHWIDYLKTRY
ncbi:MAG TPA: hypothetical protein PK323_10305 [Bacteroidia bacterium]|nr:hypothetical protein [Bacteroidia bacterium]